MLSMRIKRRLRLTSIYAESVEVAIVIANGCVSGAVAVAGVVAVVTVIAAVIDIVRSTSR